MIRASPWCSVTGERWLRGGVIGLALLAPPALVSGQGVVNAGIRGTVRTEAGALIDRAQVRVTDRETGFSVRATASDGRFLVQGLEPGRSYTLVVTSIGYVPQRVEQLSAAVGELIELELRLRRAAVELEAVTIEAARRGGAAYAHGGTALSITEPQLQALPTLNRDLFDFVRLVPQLSTRNGLSAAAFSAGGVGFRFNNFMINGASERTLAGSVSNAFAGARSVPLDAVQEYQVLVAPYDVRYGDFAGAMVNTVTKSGTNRLRGSVFANSRNDRLARGTGSSADAPYERSQFGFALGGPLIRDRLHFFVAPELQRFEFPAPGPYAGQPAAAARPVPVADTQLAELERILAERYGLIAGSAAAVENRNDLRNAFVRLDAALPAWNSRAVVWHNYAGSDDVIFSRAMLETFPLTSNQTRRAATTRMSALQLHTAVPNAGGAHNELLVSRRADRLDGRGVVQQPLIRVQLPSVTGGQVITVTGTPDIAQGTTQRLSSTSVKDNFTVPVGDHVLTIGGELERFTIYRGRAPGSFGSWTFANVANLEQGAAERYQVALNLGNALSPLRGTQYAAYATDQWRASPRLALTGGVRVDVLTFDDRPPYHRQVDSIFGRRTDVMPRGVPAISPRLGFVWDAARDRRSTVRGGAGVFTARYPLAWAHSALLSDGVSGGLLTCGRQRTDRGLPPAFNPDHVSPPRECAGGQGIGELHGDVNLLAPDLRLMRVLRGSLAWDRRLPGEFLFTGEALASRALSDFVFVNLNLAESRGTDMHGRVMYGSIASTGLADVGVRSTFAEVIDLRNTSRNYGVQLAARIERALSKHGTGSASYTWSRARDAQTPLRVAARGTVAWSSAMAYSGRHDALNRGISGNDIPHRVVVVGTYAFPRPRWRTEVSFYYIGESGRPFTYLAWGTAGRGDLNADGALNDPIYVPASASDTTEIRFSGAVNAGDNSSEAQAARISAQQQAFEEFITANPCLRRQRGRIMARNSCREPWSNTTVLSLRQHLPAGARAWEAQLDVFNVLNMLNAEWGLYRQANVSVLEHVRQTDAPAGASTPVVRFDPSRAGWVTVPAESAFQLQFALRYRF